MLRHKILIIDDDKVWLSTISEAFVQRGYVVFTAMNGSDGIKTARANNPDVIILDFHLASESAKEVCAGIKAVLELQDAPIIIASYDETVDRTAYIECGAISFVSKAGELRKILANVGNLVKHIDRARGIVVCGDLWLNPDGFRVYKNQKHLTSLTAEQFKFLSLLMTRSPGFVSEETIAKELAASVPAAGKDDAIRGLAYRIRKSLGAKTGRRIKNKAEKGWIYVQPRDHNRSR